MFARRAATGAWVHLGLNATSLPPYNVGHMHDTYDKENRVGHTCSGRGWQYGWLDSNGGGPDKRRFLRGDLQCPPERSVRRGSDHWVRVFLVMYHVGEMKYVKGIYK